ncbi:channel accessory protein ArfB [Mycobacterium sp. Marseille-P9652]|uniref:channel accessory protein ArfB n=1 Tax=Mycobacterium sp. Marseille-P9652 TaxID=2654950 RepID=UPI0018D1D2B9|nr:hypothetical protein [Mycobacterium sp. Marseille-P9652]
MDFLIQWLCYLIAFVSGSAAACAIARVAMKRASDQRAPANVNVLGVDGGR